MDKMRDILDQDKLWGFYEFFAGGGMANIGLGEQWQCLMANDVSNKKANAYKANFAPANELILDDVSNLSIQNLPTGAVMAWASFPCQDLSLAGNGKGLQGKRSGSYWGFWKLIQSLRNEGRTVPVVVLENVVGTISANQGNDFQVLLDSLTKLGYRVGPLVMNAVHFVPQSRPRLFIVAVQQDYEIPQRLLQDGPQIPWHSSRLFKAYQQLPAALRDAWLWWYLPSPSPRKLNLIDLLEEEPPDVQWHTLEETERLLELMSPLHLEKVLQVQKLKRRTVGTIYRRVRRDGQGNKAQRAEIRLDNISGCLRTGSGGSSRQFIMQIEGASIRSRLLSTREAARLMGLPETYKLPERYNEAYHLIGDGLAIPVVSWLERHLLSPLAAIGGHTSDKKIPIDHDDTFCQPVQLSLRIF